MKTIYLVILFMAAVILPSMAQKSYEMEALNLVQVNETEFTFDVRMRNTNPAEPFAIELIQWQFSFNNALMNGGSLNNTFLTYVSGTSDLVGAAIVPNSDYFSTNQVVIQWLTQALGDGAQTTLFNTGDWKRIGTFKVQLRNTGSTAFHNFADVAHNLAFVPGQVIVNWCNYTTSGGLYYRNGAYFEIINNKTLTNSLSSRKLASHCFTGTGNWSETARWNNITTANANTLPGASNNAIIAGSATTTDTRTVKDLTVASGGYLLINTAAQLTADNVYNDNTGGGGGSGVVTLASWDFQSAPVLVGTLLPYLADAGIAANISIAPFTTSATFDDFYNEPGSTIAPYGYNFRIGGGLGTAKEWKIQLSTLGYQNLKLSSKQWSDIDGSWGGVGNGPTGFIIQWSTDNSIWTDVTGGSVTVSNNWTTGVVSNLSLPSSLDNLSTVYIRWRTNASDKTKNGYTAIDDIIITGDAPPSGMLIKSTIDGTGSLIQSNTGVNATMERYIAGADWGVWNDGWHFLSSPVAAQAVDPVFNTEPYDFYSWYEPLNEWVNYKTTSGTSWATANTISNGLFNNTADFLIGKGYMAAYDNDQTKSFTGELNVTDVTITGLPINGSTATNRSWHLLGNPFSSAINWSSAWTKTNIAGTAKIWKEINQSYSDLASSGAEIPATNGFMVQVNAAPGSITIPTTARVHSTQAFYKSSDQRMMLTARNLDFPSAQESVIENNPNSTNGFDLEYDGEFLTGYAPMFFSEAENVHLSTNSLPLITSTTEIPFTFVKNEGTNFSIEAVGAITLAPEVWLMDKKNNVDHNLLLNPVYNFTSTANDDPNRFVLHFGTVSVVDIKANPDFTVWYNNGRIYFSAVPANMQKLTLIDMSGRELVNVSNPESKEVWIGSNFAKACYLVKITTQDAVVAKKIVIN